MAILVGLLTISLTLLFSTATVVPTPQSIGSDLSIITHNDLYGNLTTRHAASILLSTSFNYSVATSKCAALGTKLWDPQRHLEDLTFLRYLDYANAAYKAGVYWVSSNSTTNCTAVTARAELACYPCETYLPVLCFNAGNDRDRQVAVATNNARIIGLRERSSSSFHFLGIKYASIPARFAHSTYYPPPPGSNITALDYSPQCIQSGCGVQGTPDCAEDCLTLNIWTPHLPNVDNATRKGKAVMVWIHGGGFTGGAASDTTFDGSAMASRGDVVLVTINYRLSTLGFLALSNTSLTGNYGLHDQSVALDWLRAHVEDFGGDKDRITVFGQSAGAASVRALLASPQARNKVCGAIMMSTPQGVEYASTFSGYLTIEEATNRTAAAIAEVGCTPLKGEDTVACLRKADPLALVGIRNVSQPSGTVARSVIHSYSRMRDFRSHLVFIGWSFDIPLPLSLME